MLLRMMLIVREKTRHFYQLFCKGVVGDDLQEEEYGDDFFQRYKVTK